MVTNTPRLNLPLADPGDDTADYLDIHLQAGLITLDGAILPDTVDTLTQKTLVNPVLNGTVTGTAVGAGAGKVAAGDHSHALPSHAGTHNSAGSDPLSLANLVGNLPQARSHDTPDTDTAPTALHHTLGTGANNAAAGNHGHADNVPFSLVDLKGDLLVAIGPDALARLGVPAGTATHMIVNDPAEPTGLKWVLRPTGGIARIAEMVLSSPAAQVDFTNIPGTYRHLQVQIKARQTSASLVIAMGIRFNGDASGNYGSQMIVAGNNTLTVDNARNNQTLIEIGSAGPTNLPAFSGMTVDIDDYAGTVGYKPVRSFFSDLEDPAQSSWNKIGMYGGHWKSTVPITSISVFCVGTNLDTGTTISLYAKP